MPRLSIRVDPSRLGDALRAKEARLRARLVDAVAVNVDRLGGVVELVVPVDQGFMRDHVSRRVDDDGLSGSVGWVDSVFVDAGLPPYYTYVELGTRFAPAQPSLPTAFAEVAPKFRADVERAVADTVAEGAP